MTGCSAPHCSNQSKTCRMFRFPNRKKDKERWTLWVINCNRYNWEPSDNSRLCEAHFEGGEFVSNKAGGVKMLRKDAIPTLFRAPNPLLQKRHTRSRYEQDPVIVSTKSEEKRRHNDHDYSREMEESDHTANQVEAQFVLLQVNGHLQMVENSTVRVTDRHGTENVNAIPIEASDRLLSGLTMETSIANRKESDPTFSSKEASAASLANRQVRLLRLELQKTRRKLWRARKFLAAEKKRNARITESLQVFIRPDQIAALSKKKANLWSTETLNAAYQLLFACGKRGYKAILSQGFPLPSHRTLLRRGIEHTSNCDGRVISKFECLDH